MNTTQSKPIYTEEYTRILFQVQKANDLPTVVFFGGVHGNEKAGVKALKYVFDTLDASLYKGNVYGILGNIKALKENQRFLDEDLNRLWTKEKVNHILSKLLLHHEERELHDMFTILHKILKQNKGPLYFIDLHTTSSQTLPFITINDALINREFSKLFPVPVVLGIEEYLEGALLSYINTLGYVSIGFESGQHTSFRSVENNIAFIHLALVYAGILNEEDADVKSHLNVLKSASKGVDRFFEIVDLQRIADTDVFKMKEGFKSFQPIKKHMPIAKLNGVEVHSNYNGHIFMPLYQKKGNEGFFIIKPILPFFLLLSKILRRFKAEVLLAVLPGISWENKKEGVLKANLKVAQFLAKPIFHLLGFRSIKISKNKVLLYNRERVAKAELYKDTSWFKRL